MPWPMLAGAIWPYYVFCVFVFMYIVCSYKCCTTTTNTITLSYLLCFCFPNYFEVNCMIRNSYYAQYKNDINYYYMIPGTKYGFH